MNSIIMSAATSNENDVQFVTEKIHMFSKTLHIGAVFDGH